MLAQRLSPKAMVILLLMDVFDFTAKETAALMALKDDSTGIFKQQLRSGGLVRTIE